MKTRYKILIVVAIITIVSLVSTKIIFDIGSFEYPHSGVFSLIMADKATMVMEIKLDEYQIKYEHFTLQEVYRTGNNQVFLAEAIAFDGNRYYLMTSFEADASVDKIDVEIFKIISEKCTTGHIESKIGCESKYLEEIEKPEGIWYAGENEKSEPIKVLVCDGGCPELPDEYIHDIVEMVIGDVRKNWPVYPGGVGPVPPENFTLTKIYKDSGFSMRTIDFEAMLDDKIFVDKCESNGGFWDYHYHDCIGITEICEDIGGKPPMINIYTCTSDICLDRTVYRVSCVFVYNGE